jgi:CBS domain containing-hemolysin-like protein
VTLGELSLAVPLAIASVLISGFCSGTEVALFSLRRGERGQLAHSGLAADRRILRLLERPRRLIATVLIGTQAFDALLAVIALAVVLRYAPVSSPWVAGGIALAVAIPLSVLLAQVTSKTLAAKAPVAWARACALPLGLFALAVTPVRGLLQLVAAAVLRPLGDAARAKPSRDLSEEEFRTLVDAGSAQGQVDARERRLIHRVFEFSDKNVGQVMTPRERIFALPYDLATQRLVKEVAARGFSRVPLYQRSLDNVRGILNAKDLVRAAAGQVLGRPLGELLHEPLFVPRTTPVKRLFLTFKQKKVHMAIVVSEYGKVLGLVTMDDLLAQIFGVLRDERADLQQSLPAGAASAGRARTPVPTGQVAAPESGPVARAEAAAAQAASSAGAGAGPSPGDAAADAAPAVAAPPGVAPGSAGGRELAGADDEDDRDRASRSGGTRTSRVLRAVRAATASGGEPAGAAGAADADPDAHESDRPERRRTLPPEPPPGLRPIFALDELTPPAFDPSDGPREAPDRGPVSDGEPP